LAVCGGIIREHHGNLSGGFAKFVGTGSALIAELLGVLEGLKFAGRKGYQKMKLTLY
jgi:hypothetical protein